MTNADMVREQHYSNADKAGSCKSLVSHAVSCCRSSSQQAWVGALEQARPLLWRACQRRWAS